MKLQDLNDSDLLLATKNLVQREREILADVLKHLREVDRRRLFSSLKYKSLFEYSVKELGYSEDQAYRRINAMRLIREIPAVEKKLMSGRLTLSSLSAATSAIRAEAKLSGKPSTDRKVELIEAVEGLSRREAECTLQELTGADLSVQESVRAKGENFELKIQVTSSLLGKIEKLKGLWAHSSPSLTTAELLEKLCDQALDAHQTNLQKPPRPKSKKFRATKKLRVNFGRVAIRATVKRDVWSKADSKCESCGSVRALEIDHIIPVAHGGSNARENLRLLCRPCNQRAALESGLTRIQSYLDFDQG